MVIKEGHVMDQSLDKNFQRKQTDINDFRKEILEALPLHLREFLKKLPSTVLRDMEEIRLRANQPLIFYACGKDFSVDEKGSITSDLSKGYIVKIEDIEKAYQLITNYSVYAVEEEIRNGFITLKGGHRVGICGKVVLQGSNVYTIKNISGLNIRISKEKIGVSDRIMRYFIDSEKMFYNTLIVSPPQCGKTTLLRDMIRNLSNGMTNLGIPGFKVGVVDERSEICGVYQGIPQNNVGIRTDILDACPKAQGIMMLIRSMSPQIIATDELGKEEDIYAIQEALSAGIRILTTIHGSSIEEISRRPHLNTLIKQKIFERMVILSNRPTVGTIQLILDMQNDRVLYRKEERQEKNRRKELVG